MLHDIDNELNEMVNSLLREIEPILKNKKMEKSHKVDELLKILHTYNNYWA